VDVGIGEPYHQARKMGLMKDKIQILGEEIQALKEKWSAKYKRSINCKNPKGFSQRAHCQGRKK